jgi:hypothetical protein
MKPFREEQNQNEQISMGIKPDKAGLLYSINRQIHTLEVKLEVMPFWKNFSFVFYALSSILIPAGIIIVMVYNFNDIPLEVPIFYDPLISSWTLLDKGIAIIIPIVYAILNLFLLNLTHSIFQFDRRLAQIIGISMNIANILFLIAFSQILSIVLI